jgi:VWFA-related protein
VFIAVLLSVFSAVAIVASTHGLQQKPQVPGTFRSRITIVPLDVRVVDRNGKPVTDLKQEDFTILEDGVPQTISHFSVQSLIAEAPGPSGTLPALRTAPSADLKAQNRRVFLILLGRGRMKGPSKELPALLDFVRKRLLPQDQVAVLAFNRATGFTTNHASLVTVVEHFRDRHEKIEQMLAEYFSGLRAVYGSREIPKPIQTEIDALFEGAGTLRARDVRPGQATDAPQIADDQRRIADALQRAEILAGRTGDMAGLPDPAATEIANRMEVSFDEYIADQIELMQDVRNLYAGIDYLRYLDGEKHLVFVTPRGISLPRLENDRSIGMAASDARVAVDIIYTGGVVGAPAPRFAGPMSAQPGRLTMSPVPSAAAVFNQTFNIQALRYVSELTGGQTTAFQYADQGFNRLDASTRFQYLLGYYPSNAASDGKVRRISVKVNRGGVTALYRRGYYASDQLIPLDRRQFITYFRMTEAGRYQGEVRDIEIALKPPTMAGEGPSRELVQEISIKSPRIAFSVAEGRQTATLDLGIYCGDAKEQIVCDTLRTMELNFSEESYQRFLQSGVSFTARVRLTGEPVYVKVIVYDYGADVLGSAVAKVK